MRKKESPRKEREKSPWAVPARAAGGLMRAASLTGAQRKEIARKGANARWTKRDVATVDA